MEPTWFFPFLGMSKKNRLRRPSLSLPQKGLLPARTGELGGMLFPCLQWQWSCALHPPRSLAASSATRRRGWMPEAQCKAAGLIISGWLVTHCPTGWGEPQPIVCWFAFDTSSSPIQLSGSNESSCDGVPKLLAPVALVKVKDTSKVVTLISCHQRSPQSHAGTELKAKNNPTFPNNF